MTINETIELLESKNNVKFVKSISNYYPIKNRNILYTLWVNKKLCYIILSSNNRVVAIYDYLENNPSILLYDVSVRRILDSFLL